MKNKRKGFIVPLLIFIIAALVVGGGSYVYTKNNNAQQKKEQIKEVNDLSISKNIGVETYTYEDPNYDLKIIFPGEYKIVDRINDQKNKRYGVQFIKTNNIGENINLPVISGLFVSESLSEGRKKLVINNKDYFIYDNDRKCTGDIYGCALVMYSTEIKKGAYANFEIIYRSRDGNTASEEDINNLISQINFN